MKDGVACTAANVDDSWIGTDAGKLFSEAIGGTVTVSTTPTPRASPRWSSARAGRHRRRDHGHPRHRHRQRGVPRRQAGAEHRARSSRRSARGRRGRRGRQRPRNATTAWKQWAKRLDEYFEYLDALFSPDLIIVGGGVSKKSEKFLPLSRCRRDRAGAAPERSRHRRRRGRGGRGAPGGSHRPWRRIRLGGRPTAAQPRRTRL